MKVDSIELALVENIWYEGSLRCSLILEFQAYYIIQVISLLLIPLKPSAGTISSARVDASIDHQSRKLEECSNFSR